MTNLSPHLPPDLTAVQKSDLERLWSTQNRQLVDVRPTCESMTKIVIEDVTYRFIVRLHSFFVRFLKKQLPHDPSVETSHGMQYIKGACDSCLEAYAKMVLTGHVAAVKLLEGRVVVPVQHENFLNELQHYELQGQNVTDDYIRRYSFGAFLYHKSEQAIAAAGVAMSLAVSTLWRRANTGPSLDRFLDACQLIIRFYHVRPQMRMMDVRTSMAYKFLTIKGHVVKARPKRLRVVTADFSCPKCGAVTTHSFSQGRYSIPARCVTKNCRAKNFNLIRPTARYINVQELRLQEAQEESTAHAGRTPRQMEVDLEHDLVDSCRPGDIVMVACIVQALNSAVAEGKMGKRAKETSTYKLYLQAHSITTLSESTRRDKKQQGAGASGGSVVYTQQQLQSITQLSHADHKYFGMMERRAFPFDLLVRSICPAIIGHDMVKAGILLCLLGGTPPLSQSPDRGNCIRCNSHILIVGDPGTAYLCRVHRVHHIVSLYTKFLSATTICSRYGKKSDVASSHSSGCSKCVCGRKYVFDNGTNGHDDKGAWW